MMFSASTRVQSSLITACLIHRKVTLPLPLASTESSPSMTVLNGKTFQTNLNKQPNRPTGQDVGTLASFLAWEVRFLVFVSLCSSLNMHHANAGRDRPQLLRSTEHFLEPGEVL